MSVFEVSYVLLWLVVAFQTLVMVLIFREIGLIYLARRESFERDGPTVGDALPAVAARTITGEARTLHNLAAPLTAVIFGTTGCNYCKPVARLFERWRERIPDLGSVLVVEADGTDAAATFGDLNSDVWLIPKGDAYNRYGVRTSPFVVVVDAEGRALAKGLVNQNRDIKRLLRAADASGRLNGGRRPERTTTNEMVVGV